MTDTPTEGSAKRKRSRITEAPPDSSGRVLRRRVSANGEPLVAELTDRLLTLRYPRSRKPLLSVPWGVLVLRLLGAP